MILKEIDFLSPQITLYYKGSSSHSSITSGIISLISFLIIIFFAIHYSLDFLRWENPKAYYFIRFVDDAGLFPINSSSFFHYISISERHNNKLFDFQSFRIVGFETLYSDYLQNRNLSYFNHWIYGFCDYEKDAKDLSNLIDKDNFEKSACIRKFYNSIDQQYYDIGHPNFRWPILNHGNAHPNATSYSVAMEKCEEETLELILGKGNKCKNELEKEYLFHGDHGTNFNFIDHYVDLLDCKSPNTKYIYRVENTLDKNTYSINHINLNPSSIETNIGIFFDNIYEELSYIFDRNDVFTEYNKNDDVFMVFNLWLKNRKQYYKRIYKTLQEVISDIGGISEIVTIIAGFINSFYNNYITIVNFKNLLTPYVYKNNINNNKFKNLSKSSSNYDKDKSENTELSKNFPSKNEILGQKQIYESKTTLNKVPYIKEKPDKNESISIMENKDNNESVDENVNVNGNDEKIGNFIFYLFHKLENRKKFKII